MTNHKVKCANFEIANNKPFTLIAGPCQLESEQHALDVSKELKKKGLVFSGLSPDGSLPESIELENHPWFIGVQFHPEFKSRPFAPHPLFSSFIKAAKNNSEKND